MSGRERSLQQRAEAATVGGLIARARTAQERFADADQEAVDRAVIAAGWAIINPAHNRALAEQAVLNQHRVRTAFLSVQERDFSEGRDRLEPIMIRSKATPFS